MAALEGAISLSGLPPHRGVIINVCFFAVPSADSTPPHGGDPPAEAATDCEKVLDRVDLNTESREETLDHRFRVERPPGHYYVQVRVILFRVGDGKVLAQAEQFFFGRRPVHFGTEPEGGMTLPCSWPAQPLDELHRHGTVTPKNERPWWRFW